jgi:hypothetical protein
MRCSNCRIEAGEKDIYCRHCGADLAETSMSIVPVQSSLPALLYNSPVPRGVAVSVGALALGVGLELFRRSMLTRSTRRALSAGSTLKDVIFPRPDKTVKLPKGYEIHETVVCVTRIIRRQN